MGSGPLKVLQVEDNPGDARLVRELLTELGTAPMAVETVRTVAAALDELNRAVYDVVLLALSLPDGQGLSTLARVMEAAGSAPIVVMSGLQDESTACRALHEGAQDYLVKGHVDGHGLLRSIRYAIERKAMADQLREKECQYRLIAHNSSDLVALHRPDGVFTYVSPSYVATLGYDQAELMQRSLYDLCHPDDLPHVQEALQSALGGQPARSAYRILPKTGEIRWMETLARGIWDERTRSVQLQTSSRDISERKVFEQQLEHQALFDDLTQLPNRALFMSRLRQALARAGNRPTVAVLFIDLDNFKFVNDSLGHNLGDRLLVEVGERLRGFQLPNQTIARLGGDEFTILLEDISAQSEAVAVAERIAQQFKAPFMLGDREVFVTASIGIALRRSPDHEPDDLVRDADMAMYRAKHRGKACYETFDPGMKTLVSGRLDLESQLHRALERDELRVHYQPIVELRSSQCIGWEALVRWHHPRRGLLLPAEFIPHAEETGLVVAIDCWVMNQACRQVRTWHDGKGVVACSLGVNLSARQFGNRALVDAVGQILRESGLDAGQLHLEITESSFLRDAEAALRTCMDLKALGAYLVLDDFGTGYSSLSNLKRLPVDALKIDRSFVAGLGQSPRDTAIVRAIITFAKQLNLAVIAEGIETSEQFRELRAIGCDRGQGFYFARPKPADAIIAAQLTGLHPFMAAIPSPSTDVPRGA